jgi:uncharacterized protein YcbX
MTAEPALRLQSLHVYPVKALHGLNVHAARVEPWGLAGDRRWLIVEADDGKFITQRTDPALARVAASYPEFAETGPSARAAPLPPGTLAVSAQGQPPLLVPPPAESRGAEMLWVTVWRSKVTAAAAGPEADAWFSRYLGRPVRLVHLDDPTRRQVDPDFGQPDDRVSFADGYPLLVTSVSSLDALCDWLVDAGDEPVPMNRFRPSAVVVGAPPWDEDAWRRIRIGPVAFRVAKPCGRCVVTTTDQDTGERGRQPLAMLGRRRRFGQELVFGQNLIPEGPIPDSAGVIVAGDRVEVIERAG